jgi:hypothetical protein
MINLTMFMRDVKVTRKARVTSAARVFAVATCALALLLAQVANAAEEMQAPNGLLGARLTDSAERRLRVYGEFAFFGNKSFDAFPMVFGGGYRVLPKLELELRLPPVAIGHLQLGGFLGAPPIKFGGVGLGNLYLGANYLLFDKDFRLKVGGGLTFGPWTQNPSADYVAALGTSSFVHLDQAALFAPETFGIVIPARFEFDPLDKLMVSADAGFTLLVPTGNQDTEAIFNFAPGAAYVEEAWSAGLRLPLTWFMTESGDNAQLSLEPYGRYNLGPGFIDSRFTLNLDHPFGFSFDSGRVWSLFFGGGVAFF